MKAIIMAGGEGSRLRPLTCGIPKPLVPVAGETAIKHIITQLNKYGVYDIGVTLFYLPNKIKDYLSGEFDNNIKYYIEDKPLGTAGSVKNAKDFLDETFIVMSGDVVTDIDLDKAYDFHKRNGSKATLVLTRVDIPLEYGVVIIDKDGKVIRFMEKPSWGEVFSDTVNTGIYIIEPEVLNYIPDSKQFDFSKDLFPILLKNNIPIYGYVSDKYWCDIGNTTQYLESHFDILNGKVNLGFTDKLKAKELIIGRNVKIDSNAKLIPPAIIGDGTYVDENATIGPYAIIGKNNNIKYGATIKKSILWDNVNIGANNEIRGAILCNDVKTENNVRLFNNSIVGAESRLKSFCEVKPNVKIWPNKVIGAGSIVESDIVWGNFDVTSIFGERGIRGSLSDNLNPHYLMSIGEVIGNVFKDNILIGHDGTKASKFCLEFLISGIKASGQQMYISETTILPAIRYSIIKNKFNGGIYIQNNVDEMLNILLLDSNGCDIDKSLEKKIMNKLRINDYKIVSYDKLKDPIYKKINKEYAEYIESGIIGNKNLNVKLMDDTTKELFNIFDIGKLKEATTNAYDIGIKISKNGEDIELYDENGSTFDKDELDYLRILIEKDLGKSDFVLPFDSSKFLSEMSEELNFKTSYSKVAESEKMKKMLEFHNKAIDNNSQFNLSFDGLNFSFKLIDYLEKNKKKLSDIKKFIPRRYKLSKMVNCEWKDKGLIIRKFYENPGSVKTEFLDGIKFDFGKSWVLIKPDSELPACKILTEAPSKEEAQVLLDKYEKNVNNIINGELKN